jgi:hypothetical protein
MEAGGRGGEGRGAMSKLQGAGSGSDQLILAYTT